MENNKGKKIESAFKRIEEIKQLMQAGSVSIDDAIPLVEEASNLRDMVEKEIKAAQLILKEKQKED